MHIKNAVNIPVEQLKMCESEYKNKKSKNNILYGKRIKESDQT